MSIIEVYLDEKHNKVSEEEARWLVVTEYDSKGKVKTEEWVDLK